MIDGLKGKELSATRVNVFRFYSLSLGPGRGKCILSGINYGLLCGIARYPLFQRPVRTRGRQGGSWTRRKTTETQACKCIWYW